MKMNKDNLALYNEFRDVPDNAKKEIKAGRLKGFTDINPMWRIKKLTERFGAAGEGWYFDRILQRIEEDANGQKALFIDINLYYKLPSGEWSKPIFGNGGSMLVANERNGLYLSDEAVKMAVTDAISSAAKLLGMGADVYFEKDRTKYDGEGADGMLKEDKPTISRQKIAPQKLQPEKPEITDEILDRLEKCVSRGAVRQVWNDYKQLQASEEFKSLIFKYRDKFNE